MTDSATGKAMTMVEKVARALFKDQFVFEGSVDDAWKNSAPMVRDDYRGHARAAIEAMRKPTRKMLDAAGKSMSPSKRPTKSRISNRAKHAHRYRSMIDAILSEEKE